MLISENFTNFTHIFRYTRYIQRHTSSIPMFRSVISVQGRSLVLRGIPRVSPSVLVGYNRNYASWSNGTPIRKQKTKEEIEEELLQEQMKSPHRIVRWGAIARSEKFKKGLTKYMIAAYMVFLFFGYKHIQKLREKELELEELLKKQSEGTLNEYESLRIKEMKGTARTRDLAKLKEYRKLKEESPELETFDGIVLDDHSCNTSNSCILPPRDTMEFFEKKAEEYDSGVNFEEKLIMMGRRRKWLARHCHGDVLEVACGTGRNIKFMDMTKIKSVTFLDASEKMVELANKKFRAKFPNFKNAAFVVGRAEDLVQLASAAPDKTSEDKVVKYDTIIEAFGLCSYHDPVKALNNFAKLLKPDGRIILLEHGRGTWDIVNKVIDDRAEKRLKTWGCRWNLDIGEIIEDSELEIVTEDRTHFGTTWCIVAKRKGDAKKKNEIGFVEKYLRSSVKARIEEFRQVDEVEKSKK
ncbi:HBR341Wp [Eremothecium sinecaudum]|uniref:HBR341Wp n=1 Tax=Eremothecium sinecaudum TaxID=45286 RepID=A0A109UXQ2_9SACH|nr:HBR341Wp [Eremothecium sinecaudum]AMD19242.1 HBR341Wp [Eremothecium sinecaudum]